MRWQIGIVVGLAMVVGVAVFSYERLASLESSSAEVAHTYAVLEQIADAAEQLSESGAARRAFFTSRDEREAERLRDHTASLRRDVEALRALTVDNARQQRHVDALAPLVNRRIALHEESVAHIRAVGPDQAYEIEHLALAAPASAAVRSVLAEMKAEEIRLLGVRGDDATRKSSATRTTILVAIGAAVALLGFAFLALSGEIRQRRKNQLELERWGKIFEHAGWGIGVEDSRGPSFNLANPAFARMHGYDSVKELLAAGSSAVRPLKQDEIKRRAGDVSGHASWETLHRRKDGTTFPVHVDMATVKDEQDRILYRIGSIIDITARRVQDEEIRSLNERLAKQVSALGQVNKELEAFSYSVSHDLRAPLRGIDGFSQALLEDYGDKLDDTGKDYLGRVRAAATRMATLIDDLLALARVTRAEMKPSVVDLTQVANGICAEVSRAAPERKVNFVVKDGLTAAGDPHLLRVVLDNLIRNAHKFTQKKDSACVEVGTVHDAGRSVFFVKDNGAGFDMTYADKLFGAFQRLHTVSEFPGTGIGLATCQRIVQRHGGRIWAEATVDRGATFYFTLG